MHLLANEKYSKRYHDFSFSSRGPFTFWSASVEVLFLFQKKKVIKIKISQSHYGRSRKGTHYQRLYEITAIPPRNIQPSKVAHDRSSMCIGCPYPRHGLMCHDKDGSCLRSEMRELEEKWQRERQAKVNV